MSRPIQGSTATIRAGFDLHLPTFMGAHLAPMPDATLSSPVIRYQSPSMAETSTPSETRRIIRPMSNPASRAYSLTTPTVTVAPINKAPREILSTIFEHFVLDWEYDIIINIQTVSPMFHQLVRGLTSICRVSKNWRSVAFSSPRLWRNVLHCSLERELKQLHSFSMCVERSRAVSLNVWISGENEVSEVVLHLDRVGALQRLVCLHIGHANFQNWLIEDEESRIFYKMNCPNVNRMALDYVTIPISEFADALTPFPNLRQLRLLQVTVMQEALQALHPSATPPPEKIVRLDKLEKFEILQEPRNVVSYILETVCTPNLTCLSIVLLTSTSTGSNAPLSLANAPWICNSLRKLALGNSLEIPDVLGVLRCIVGLTNLHFFRTQHANYDADANYDEVMKALQITPNAREVLVPTLRVISFWGYPVTSRALRAMICSRREQHTIPIKAVGLDTEFFRKCSHDDFLKITEITEVFNAPETADDAWEYD